MWDVVGDGVGYLKGRNDYLPNFYDAVIRVIHGEVEDEDGEELPE